MTNIRRIIKTTFSIGLLAAVSTLSSISFAQLTPYSQDFETLLPAGDPSPLAGLQLAIDGWNAFLFVTDSLGTPRFGDNITPPNGGPGYSAIASGEAGLNQGLQYLNAYSDYNCCGSTPGANDWGHFAVTDGVEVSLFQEQTIAIEDVGLIYTFEFDAKRPSSPQNPETAVGVDGLGGIAAAFIKTLDQNNNFNQTNNIQVDMTAISQTDWGTYTIEIEIIPALVGQLLQFGFTSTASNFANTGVYYDNLSFSTAENVPFPPFAAALLGLAVVGLGVRQLKK